MRSLKKQISNRQNALRSTGPTSPEGKRRASHNAHAHGLSIPISYSKTLKQQRQNLARELGEEYIFSEQEAFDLASSLISLKRIREAEGLLLKSSFQQDWIIDGARNLTHTLKMIVAIKRYRAEARAQLRRLL